MCNVSGLKGLNIHLSLQKSNWTATTVKKNGYFLNSSVELFGKILALSWPPWVDAQHRRKVETWQLWTFQGRDSPISSSHCFCLCLAASRFVAFQPFQELATKKSSFKWTCDAGVGIPSKDPLGRNALRKGMPASSLSSDTQTRLLTCTHC